MRTYRSHPDPEKLYIWNTRVAKTYLEDIQHVEVLLRNSIDIALTARYGPHWFDDTLIPFAHPAKATVRKAKNRAGEASHSPANPGKVIAELPLDFWRFLLTNTYSSTVWPLLKKLLPRDISRGQFENEVIVFYEFRNRSAHHEPLVRPTLVEENAYLDRVSNAIFQTAPWLSPSAAQWIQKYSPRWFSSLSAPLIATKRPRKNLKNLARLCRTLWRALDVCASNLPFEARNGRSQQKAGGPHAALRYMGQQPSGSFLLIVARVVPCPLHRPLGSAPRLMSTSTRRLPSPTRPSTHMSKLRNPIAPLTPTFSPRPSAIAGMNSPGAGCSGRSAR